MEEYHSTDHVKILPVDIESTFLGREINNLLETISGVESVQPYSDVSFRIISKIADVLTTDNNCQAFNIGRNTDDPTKDLFRFYKELYRQKKQNEQDHWVDVPSYFIDSLDPNQLQRIQDQHYIFSQSNGIALLKMFLMSKVEENE